MKGPDTRNCYVLLDCEEKDMVAFIHSKLCIAFQHHKYVLIIVREFITRLWSFGELLNHVQEVTSQSSKLWGNLSWHWICLPQPLSNLFVLMVNDSVELKIRYKITTLAYYIYTSFLNHCIALTLYDTKL